MLAVGLLGARDGDRIVLQDDGELILIRPATPVIADAIIPQLPRRGDVEEDPPDARYRRPLPSAPARRASDRPRLKAI